MRTGEHFGLIARIGGAMVAVSIVVLALASMLSLLRFEETYKRLVAQRLEVAAREIGRTLQVGLDLGLPVEAQGHLPDLLHQYVGAHPDIRSIVIHSCNGPALIREGRQAGEPWLGHLARPSWFAVGDDGISVGISISDPLGACAVGVAVTQSAQAYNAAVATVGRQFLITGVAAGAAATAAMIAAAFLLGRRRRALHETDKDLAAILAGAAVPEAAAFGPQDAREGWESDLVIAYLAARPAIITRVRNGRAPT